MTQTVVIAPEHGEEKTNLNNSGTVMLLVVNLVISKAFFKKKEKLADAETLLLGFHYIFSSNGKYRLELLREPAVASNFNNLADSTLAYFPFIPPCVAI